MNSMTGRLIALLMLTAILAAAPSPVPAGQAERRAEDAAAEAKQSKDATEKLKANKPFPYKTQELRRYRNALERAEGQEEKSGLKAANSARQAERASDRAASASRERAHRQRRVERKERNQRRRRDINGTSRRR